MVLRTFLGKALTRRGFGMIVFEPVDDEKGGSGSRAGWVITFELIWGLTASAAFALGVEWYLVPVVLVGVLVALAAAVALLGESPLIGGVLTLLWIAAGVVSLSEGEIGSYAIAYLVPLALVISYFVSSWALRVRDAEDLALALAGVIKSAPLLAPVVVIVLFLPALSRDVWEVAAQISLTSLVCVGMLSVGLLFAVVRMQLGREVEVMLAERATALGALGGRGGRTRSGLEVALDEENPKWLRDFSDEELEAAWPKEGAEYAPYLFSATGNVFSRPLAARLLLTIAVVGVLLFIYIYLLSSAVVAGPLAERWSGASLPSVHLDLVVTTITLYGGPYLKLAGLLGLVATATFLAFALVEERFASALTAGLLREPGEGFLVLALPYLALREHQLSSELAEAASGGSG